MATRLPGRAIQNPQMNDEEPYNLSQLEACYRQPTFRPGDIAPQLPPWCQVSGGCDGETEKATARAAWLTQFDWDDQCSFDNIRNTLYLERDGQVCDPDDANQDDLQCCPSELVSYACDDKTKTRFVDARLNQASMVGLQLNNFFWQGATLAGAQLQNSTISQSVITAADASNANVSGSEFTTVDLRGTDFTNANLDRTIFRDVQLDGAKLNGASMVNARIEDAQLAGSEFKALRAQGSVIRGREPVIPFQSPAIQASHISDWASSDNVSITWRDTQFQNSNLSNIALVDVFIHNADFSDTELRNVSINPRNRPPNLNFTGSRIESSFWQGEKNELLKLTNMELRNAELINVYFVGPSFLRLTAEGARFTNVSFLRLLKMMPSRPR